MAATRSAGRAARHALGDRLHELLLAHCEVDHETGCWIWTRAWNPRTGHGVLSVRGRVMTVHRVAAWIYRGGFELDDDRIRVFHRAHCLAAACFNPDHLGIVRGGQAALIRELARQGRCKPGPGRPKAA